MQKVFAVFGPLDFHNPCPVELKKRPKVFFSQNPLFGPLSKIIRALICSKRPVKKQRMTIFWQNFGIWAELFFGTNFWALFWALSVGVVNSKGSQNAKFWNIRKYLNILSKSFILSKYSQILTSALFAYSFGAFEAYFTVRPQWPWVVPFGNWGGQLEPAFPSEAVGAKAPSVLPARKF